MIKEFIPDLLYTKCGTQAISNPPLTFTSRHESVSFAVMNGKVISE